MLSSDNIVKLIDFGNATLLSNATGYNSTGTPAFMAPELLRKGTYKNTLLHIQIIMHALLLCI
jgi:serine/threonine protein kinase